MIYIFSFVCDTQSVIFRSSMSNAKITHVRIALPTAKMRFLLFLTIVACKSTSVPTIVRENDFPQDCKCWNCSSAPKPVPDGWESYYMLSSTGLGQDPISTSQLHTHITYPCTTIQNPLHGLWLFLVNSYFRVVL